MKTVAFVALARPTFDLGYAERNFQGARALLNELGVEVVGPERPIMTPEDVAATQLPIADLYILLTASFSDASPAVELLSNVKGPILGWSMREPGENGERLKLNSMCGINLAAHALLSSGQNLRHLHGNFDEPEVKAKLKAAIDGELPSAKTPENRVGELGSVEEANQALTRLREKKIGAIGDAPVGFTPCIYNEAQLKEIFGVEVIQIPVKSAFDRLAEVDEGSRELAYASAVAAQKSLAAVNKAEALKVSAAEVAFENWIAEENLDAMAVRCWPEFPTDLGACICSSLGRISDRGTITTCERDVLGAVTMLVCEALGSDENYLVDIVDLDASQNLIRLWHCGSAATKLAADPTNATQSIHCNRKLGVAGDFPLKTGAVTLFRIDRDMDPNNTTGLRIVMSRGQSIPAPNRFQGNTATVVTEPDAALLVNGIITGGYPHHLVISWVDVRPGLRRLAQMLEIPLTEW